MTNRLKEIFSDEEISFEGSIRPIESGGSEELYRAIQKVWKEGRPVEVSENFILNTKMISGESKYPKEKNQRVERVDISPQTETFSIPLKTEYGEKTLLFKRYTTIDKVISETDRNELIYLKIEFIKNTTKTNFSYELQYNLASTVKEIFEGHNTLISFINIIFNNDQNQESHEDYKTIEAVKKSLLRAEVLFKKLDLLEKKFKISFNPKDINEIEDSLEMVEELYFLFIKNVKIRLNERLNDLESTGSITYDEFEIGKKINITFISDREYNIFGKKIPIYTANLVSNAIIKDIKTDIDGMKKIIYSDTDSTPMYISYRAFKTIDEAKNELEIMMNDIEKYEQALTLEEYMILENN